MSEISGQRANTFGMPHLTSVATALIALLALAAANGFPFVFADTGGYLARPFERTLALGRSALYGLLLASGIRWNFWPIIVVQGLLALWLIWLALRVYHGEELGVFAFVVALLILCTSLPWYTGMLMPDIFVPLAALALLLLAFSHDQLTRMEELALLGLVAFAMASHLTILALAAALLVALFALKLLAVRLALPSPRLLHPVLAAAGGIALALVSNVAITGQLRLTPGGSTFLFARLLQDGLVARYLDDHCPHANIRLCSFRAELPRDSDVWLWANSPLAKLGGWEAFEPEARRIILGSIFDHPWLHTRAAIVASLEQFVTVATGEGFHAKDNWHAEIMLKRYAPDTAASFAASRQQHDAFEFRILNIIHVPVALASCALLPVFAVLLRRSNPQLALLAAMVFFALLANAAICGIFSNPNARYQSRIVPLAVLATFMIAVDWACARGAVSDMNRTDRAPAPEPP
jgi:hypothetical protein